jgi:hypothetical protein
MNGSAAYKFKSLRARVVNEVKSHQSKDKGSLRKIHWFGNLGSSVSLENIALEGSKKGASDSMDFPRPSKPSSQTDAQ